MKITLTESLPGQWDVHVAPTTPGEQDAPPTVLQITQALHAVQGDLLRQLVEHEESKKAKAEKAGKILLPDFDAGGTPG